MASSSSLNDNMMTLKSRDKVKFKVKQSVANMSVTLKNVMEDIMESVNFSDMEFPVPNVDGGVLAKIIEYCEKHVDLSSDGVSKEEKDILRQWDSEFVNVDLDTLYDLIMAANYLEIKGLLDLVCQKTADLIKGKMPEQIRKEFNIKNDFTPEEEAKIREENKWAFEESK